MITTEKKSFYITTFSKELVKELKNIKLGYKTIEAAVIDNFDWFILRDVAGKFLTIPVWALVPAENSIMDYSTRMQKRMDRIEHNQSKKCAKHLSPRINFTSVAWVIPSVGNAKMKKAVNLPEAICNVARSAETNKKLTDFSISKEFEKCGYTVCGLCRGVVIEQKHPSLEEISKNIKFDENSSIQDLAWEISEIYSKKITDQFLEFAKRKPNAEVYLDSFGLGF